MTVALTLGSENLQALPSGALHWPAQALLAVSDLHFGKSARLARRGGALLPPYETRATLDRLAADLASTGARTVACLGDSFDDLAAAGTLDAADLSQLAQLMAGRDWIWIEGNHDPGPPALGGRHLAQWQRQGLTFRHIAEPAGSPEVSGHYHPKARLAGRARPCFLTDGTRLILPAYGTYTGGLWCHDPALAALMGPGARAVLTGAAMRVIPMPRTPR